jgi:hypothetical protein
MIDELEVVRRVGADEQAPDAAARERVRARVLRPAARPRRRRSWFVLVPAGAAALVVVLVVALGTGTERDEFSADRSLADAPQLFPPPDQYLYVRSETQGRSCAESATDCALDAPQPREVWVSEARSGRLRDAWPLTPERLEPVPAVVGTRRFSHGQLAAWRPSAGEIRDALEAAEDRVRTPLGSSPVAQAWSLLRERPLPPAVRFAVIEALPTLGDVTVARGVRDARGRPATRFTAPLRGARLELFVDERRLLLLQDQLVVTAASGVPAGVNDRAVYLGWKVVDALPRARPR